MVSPQIFAAIILLLDISAKSYSVPYESTLALSTSARLIYTASEPNPTLTGYSYATQDLNGDGSNVVFMTGADSVSRLQNKMIPSYKASGKNMPSRHLQKDMLTRVPETSMSSGFTSKTLEINMTNEKKLESNTEILTEEKELPKHSEANDNFVKYQVAPPRVSFLPYSTFKTNFLQLPTVNTEYPITSNIIERQYYSDNLYDRLEQSLHNFDFYNPAVPFFYQSAVTIPENSFKLVSTISEDVSPKPSTGSSITKDPQTNAESSSSKSGIETSYIASRSNMETTKIAEDAFTTSEKVKEEVTNKSINYTETPKITTEQIMESKVNSTEAASTETTSLSSKKLSAKNVTYVKEHDLDV